FQAERTGRSEPRKIPGRFFVYPYLARVYRLEIAKCDCKFGAWRPADSAAGFYGAWGGNALQRPPFADGGECQHRHHADVRSAAAATGDAGRIGAAVDGAGGNGEAPRSLDQGDHRRAPTDAVASGAAATA